MNKREQLVEVARGWIGTPWRHLGRNRQGIDCAGLGVVVLRELGISGYDMTAYSRIPAPGMLDHIRKVADEVPLNEARPGDVIVITDAIYPFHVAFRSERDGLPHIIHAHAQRRKVVEEHFAHEWKKLASHAFVIRGIDEDHS